MLPSLAIITIKKCMHWAKEGEFYIGGFIIGYVCRFARCVVYFCVLHKYRLRTGVDDFRAMRKRYRIIEIQYNDVQRATH